ncbi:peptidase S8/S53 domain-containing protein [Hypoxylon sp. FL0890]|nr:peptidase S8/S53 domain-containing protein [Hypoxylon sp. FL0890]
MASSYQVFLDVGVVYVIYPKDGTDESQTAIIEEKVRAHAVPTTVYTSQTASVGINFWLATLSHESADILAVELAHEIASIYPQLPTDSYNPRYDTFDQTTAITYQDKPEPPNSIAEHLVFVCQEKGRSLQEYEGRYYYDNADPLPGRNIPVYIVDTGATLDHKEFDAIREKVEWIHVGQDIGGGNANDDSSTDPSTDPDNRYNVGKAHGTAMLSLVTGAQVGVSKGAKPYLVRMPRRIIPKGTSGNRSGQSTNEDWLEGISKVNDHLAGRCSETRAILLLAIFIPRSSFRRDGKDCSAGFDARMRFLLNDLVSKGVLPITGAGNDTNMGTTIDGFPANYGRTDYRPIPELMVVGGVHSSAFALGSPTDFDRGLPHIFAPSQAIKCADGNRGLWGMMERDDTYRSATSSSCAAAITVGLAAYFLRLAQIGRLEINTSPLGLKNFILSDDLKWSRCSHTNGRELPAIWNGVKLPEPRSFFGSF